MHINDKSMVIFSAYFQVQATPPYQSGDFRPAVKRVTHALMRDVMNFPREKGEVIIS